MGRQFLPLVAICLIVSGCATAPPPSSVSERFARDGLGHPPKRLALTVRERHRPSAATASRQPREADPNADREKVLATLHPYSAAWWVVRDEIDAEEQRRINAKLVICRSCLQKKGSPEDYTGSVSPK